MAIQKKKSLTTINSGLISDGEPLLYKERAIKNSPDCVYTRNPTTSRSERGKNRPRLLASFTLCRLLYLVHKSKGAKKEAYWSLIYKDFSHAAVEWRILRWKKKRYQREQLHIWRAGGGIFRGRSTATLEQRCREPTSQTAQRWVKKHWMKSKHLNRRRLIDIQGLSAAPCVRLFPPRNQKWGGGIKAKVKGGNSPVNQHWAAQRPQISVSCRVQGLMCVVVLRAGRNEGLMSLTRGVTQGFFITSILPKQQQKCSVMQREKVCLAASRTES